MTVVAVRRIAAPLIPPATAEDQGLLLNVVTSLAVGLTRVDSATFSDSSALLTGTFPAASTFPSASTYPGG
jgi:hypothetical protein